MVTPVEKRNSNKFCDFHNDKGHSTDECMQLKKQIEELVRAGKLSNLIKEIKQGREQPKTGRKEAAAKDKPTTIYMVRSWQRTVKQKVTQSFEQGKEIAFPPLTTSNGTEGPLVIEAEIGGHIIHRMYIDGRSSMEILYEHCFNRLRPEIKSQNGPNDYIADWVQWRDYMAARTTKTPSDHRRRHPFYQSMDELHGCKVVVTLQRKISTAVSDLKKCIKKSDFRWTVEAEQAFQQLKQHLSDLPLLVAPRPQEELIMYLSATHGAISAVLMTERGTVQTPIYFISRALQEGVEFTYALMFQFAASNNKAEYEALVAELVNYLKEGILPGDEKEARKLRLKARQYELMEGVLYQRSFLTPWLRCVGPLQAEYVMREIHEGSCSMHAGLRSVVAKAIRLGYYWPTMHRDARDMIRKCSDCQIHRPAPFRRDREGQIPDSRHGLLHKVDRSKGGGNDYRRAGEEIRMGQYCMPLRLVERANRSLREGIKARLGEGNKNWVEELPHVLWAHRTMIKSSHGDTPFSLKYGTEAVIHAEIEMPTYRTAAVDLVNNHEELRLNLDLLEERRELAAVSEAKSKSKMMKYYNARVRGVAFKLGDFVYRSNDASHAVAGGKLGPKWEGPYEVTDVLGNGAYKLRSTEGTVLPRTWNVTNLKRCYL
nr:reverse transcriptase domain-containing protein [Tanacetum cinerariifolium]